MPAAFDPDRLLDALPRRPIPLLPAETVVPRVRAVSVLSDYNGFTGKERLRTFEVAKWLFRLGVMTHSGQCNMCGKTCGTQHAEDYYDLSTWMDLCRGCHLSRLHKRFANPAPWQRWLDQLQLPADHWARHVSDQPFDLAGLLRARGRSEPSYHDFVL